MNDFLEESKKEEEDNDGFRKVKKGPTFDQDEYEVAET